MLFLRKRVPGGANRSYGIEVARFAGLLPEVVTRARDILQNLESGEFDDSGRPRLARRGSRAPSPGHLGLSGWVAEPEPKLELSHQNVLEALKAVKLDETTPLEALNLLAKLRRRGSTPAVTQCPSDWGGGLALKAGE